MMNIGLEERDLGKLIDAAKDFPDIDEVILFGSRAKGNYKQGSDVDLAVKGESLSETTVKRLSARLNEEVPLPFFFDVIQYESITSSELIDHIKRVGKIIYRRDPGD